MTLATRQSRDPLFGEFDRMAERLLGGSDKFTGMISANVTLPMDVVRRGESLLLRFDVPGVDPDKVEVTLDGRVLTVTVERPYQWEEEDQVLIGERSYGKAMRRINLPQDLDLESLEAAFDQGVVALSIPFSEKAKPRRIDLGGQREITAQE